MENLDLESLLALLLAKEGGRVDITREDIENLDLNNKAIVIDAADGVMSISLEDEEDIDAESASEAVN